MPPLVLNAAHISAARLLADGGVPTSWMVCPASSVMPGGAGCGDGRPLSISIRILPSDKARAWHVEPTSCGAALPGTEGEYGYLAVIDAGCIHRMAGERHRALEALLGHVLAHEVGHLLLGQKSHGSLGLMRATWSKAERVLIAGRRLPFSRDDAARLRVGFEGRSAAARGLLSENSRRASNSTRENPSQRGAVSGHPD